MMGLFDGYSRSRGSAAEIASILNLPVVLVVDAKSTAYSLAPLLKGFKEFSREVNIIGVIFNKVGSPKHRKMLEEVCQDTGLEPLGFIPKAKEAESKSRYLGLDNVDIDRLIALTERPVPEFSNTQTIKDKHKILVARNEESFSFIYQEHLDGWKNIEFFNPEQDADIPQDIDLLYLPGGYPEKHLETLSKCRKTMESIKRFAEGGGKILAECGGMMYLCRSILTDEGEFPMCGVLPYSITARTEDRKLCLGYRSLNINGLEIKGHEFHYTKFTDPQPESSVIRIKNTIASYTHLYWGDKDIFGIF